MANQEDGYPSSPLTPFHREFAFGHSRLNTGPFKATQIWNEVIAHLKERVELKRRRYKLRNYDQCFTGIDAVDVVLHYLLSDQDTFSNLSREKAVKLCQTLMDKNVFRPVGLKSGDMTRHQFEDSSGKLYHFDEPECTSKENKTPRKNNSDDESEGHDEVSDNIMDLDDETLFIPHEPLRINVDPEKNISDDVVDSSPISDVLQSKMMKDVPESKKIRNCNISPICFKRQKIGCSSSSESVIDDFFSDECERELMNELVLCQLLTIVDVSFLDDVLNEDKDNIKSSKKVLKPCNDKHVSNIVAKQWSLQCSAKSAIHSDPFMRAALGCIAHIPRGISKFDTDFTSTFDPVTKLQAYNMICDHYSKRVDALIPDRFQELIIAIIKLMLEERQETALQAMQLNMVLMPNKVKLELKRLMQFLAASFKDKELLLDTVNQKDNEREILSNFTNSVLKFKELDWNHSSMFVQFLIHHVNEVFTSPPGLQEKVDSRISEIKSGIIPIVEETVFCSQIPLSVYQFQMEECTNNSLVQMMNSIIDNPKLALKEKKNRLQQFKKCHPDMCEENGVHPDASAWMHEDNKMGSSSLQPWNFVVGAVLCSDTSFLIASNRVHLWSTWAAWTFCAWHQL